MNEAIRMQYLEAMGLDSYVPRVRLPNAPTPQRCELPVVSAAIASSAAAPANQSLDVADTQSATAIDNNALRTLSDGLNSVLADLGVKPKNTQVERPEAVEAVNDEAILSVEQAEFTLALWFIHGMDIQVVDTRNINDALPTDALLCSILRSVNSQFRALPQVEVQTWPFPGSAGGDNSWAAACSMMEDFFEHRFVKTQAKSILVFGIDAAKALLGEHIDFDALCYRCVKSAEPLGLPVIVLPSLRDLLYTPLSKKHLWSALAPLRRV